MWRCSNKSGGILLHPQTQKLTLGHTLSLSPIYLTEFLYRGKQKEAIVCCFECLHKCLFQLHFGSCVSLDHRCIRVLWLKSRHNNEFIPWFLSNQCQDDQKKYFLILNILFLIFISFISCLCDVGMKCTSRPFLEPCCSWWALSRYYITSHFHLNHFSFPAAKSNGLRPFSSPRYITFSATVCFFMMQLKC